MTQIVATTPVPKKQIKIQELDKLRNRIKSLREEWFAVSEIAHFLWDHSQVISNIMSGKTTKENKYKISREKLHNLNLRYEQIFPNQ